MLFKIILKSIFLLLFLCSCASSPVRKVYIPSLGHSHSDFIYWSSK